MNTSNERPTDHGIIILDYGSQYTLLIARRLRELGAYSEIIAPSSPPPTSFQIHGIILSGGPDSVTSTDKTGIPEWVIRSQKPILGICYGMQLLVEHFGGQVRSNHHREFGHSTITLQTQSTTSAIGTLFSHLATEQKVWMSHGDDIATLTDQFDAIAHSDQGAIAIVAHQTSPYIGLQFHPEVHHTEKGSEILSLFLNDVCRTQLNWEPGCMVQGSIEAIRKAVGKGSVLMAVSGGVDSTVAAVLLNRALDPSQVTTVFIDHGLLRYQEAEQVRAYFQQLGVKNFVQLDCHESFLKALANVSDPEEKRRIIGHQFIEEFENFAKGHDQFTHLGQGTLYPDVIESAGHGSGSKVIKSHHNVGGLPEKLALKLLEPFRFLFKDEVRSIGNELGIPEKIIHRHPFPGPGLAVRILGPIDSEKITILQQADAIFINALKESGLYDEVWQAFAVLLPVKTVGVMGDNRTYQWTCALRAVCAVDGMTATVSPLPLDFLTAVADEIVRKVDGINRVVYDMTSKPPGTIEWE